ncbi:HD-GYP domain-containing protein [Denitromonas iodatirespirans]|uniref:Response regulator n=1 Tax=Denitromonas iodatirespirans TaxID=2795389 RepID=A0A944DAP9_DENI1|nr:HD domain-containing phosphohydrolase [Denitromonas iodatirespirans]MBT0963300.1 response regulator [Denitromonas iodatirespirans]
MRHKGEILAVDDTPASLRLLTDILRGEGYQVRSAISGELALGAAMRQPPELVLLDINMPGMDGFEVCTRLKQDERTRDLPVIFVSASAETGEKVKGLQIGAVDYVTKPFQREELLARVHTHLELYRLRHRLEDVVAERTHSLHQSELKLRKTLLDSVMAIAATVEMRDPYTAGHQRRVAEIGAAIARDLGMSEHRVEGLRLACVVHDVGKVKIPAEILNKPGRLSKLEFELIKNHAQDGYEVLKEIDFPWPIAQFVLQHHERLDGSGYPNGLKGEQILPESRILSVADVIEAMASHRPYRPGLGIEAALTEIEVNRGDLFDSEVVEVALNLFRHKGYQIDFSGRISTTWGPASCPPLAPTDAPSGSLSAASNTSPSPV